MRVRMRAPGATAERIDRDGRASNLGCCGDRRRRRLLVLGRIGCSGRIRWHGRGDRTWRERRSRRRRGRRRWTRWTGWRCREAALRRPGPGAGHAPPDGRGGRSDASIRWISGRTSTGAPPNEARPCRWGAAMAKWKSSCAGSTAAVTAGSESPRARSGRTRWTTARPTRCGTSCRGFHDREDHEDEPARVRLVGDPG